MWTPAVGTAGPELVRIGACYQNGVVDVTPLDFASGDFTRSSVRLVAKDGAQLLRLDERSPRYVGERVRLRHVDRVRVNSKYLREVPYRHGPPLARLGTDLHGQTIYAPSGKGEWTVYGTWDLDGLWKLRGLDGVYQWSL